MAKTKQKKELRGADTPIYHYWNALYLAFYSSRLYVDVARRWRGLGIWYLLLVIAVAAIPLSARIICDFNRYFDEQMTLPLERLPMLYIQNGEIVFDKPMPYFMKNNTGKVAAIVDTTGTVTKMNKLYPELTLLITKDRLYFRPPKFQLFSSTSSDMAGDTIYVQPFSKKSNEIFVGKEWVKNSGITTLKLMTELMVYPLITLFVFILYVGFMFALAMLAQVFAQVFFQFKLQFKEAFRLFLVASTAPIALFFVVLTGNIILPGAGFFYMALVAIYFSYAVISVRRESKKMVLA